MPDDIRYILQQHFPGISEIRRQALILRQTRHAQQQKILALYGYRACQDAERAHLADQARQMVRVSAKPLYLFQALMRYLEAQHIVVPGYSVLQDIVSRALAAERQRLTTLIDRALDPVTRAALDALYVNREGVYAITALKHEPKDFSLKELKQEITRNQALSGVYQTACALLAELGISNDSVSYYAALVDYYTVQKLQQFPTGMVYLYVLCFIRHRYQKFHDNLIHVLILQVRKVIDAAKVATQEKILCTPMRTIRRISGTSARSCTCSWTTPLRTTSRSGTSNGGPLPFWIGTASSSSPNRCRIRRVKTVSGNGISSRRRPRPLSSISDP